ncbi:hypothetical protein EV714DRAFT_236341 [Schizophyllum commune]
MNLGHSESKNVHSRGYTSEHSSCSWRYESSSDSWQALGWYHRNNRGYAVEALVVDLGVWLHDAILSTTNHEDLRTDLPSHDCPSPHLEVVFTSDWHLDNPGSICGVSKLSESYGVVRGISVKRVCTGPSRSVPLTPEQLPDIERGLPPRYFFVLFKSDFHTAPEAPVDYSVSDVGTAASLCQRVITLSSTPPVDARIAGRQYKFSAFDD